MGTGERLSLMDAGGRKPRFGVSVFVVLSAFGLAHEVALGAGLLIGLVVRGMALRRGWSLPRYRERLGRTLDEINGPE